MDVTIPPTTGTLLIRNVIFFGLVVFFLSDTAVAKNISEEDIRAYLDDPIFNDLWFGIYDKNNQKYGWWHAREYREGDYWVFEEEAEVKLLDRIEVGKRVYDDKILIRTRKKEFYRIDGGFLLSRVEFLFEQDNEVRTTMASIVDGNVHVQVNSDGREFSYDVEGFFLRLDEVYRLEILLRKYDDWRLGEVIDYKYYDIETFRISGETDVIREIDETFRDGVTLKYYQVETLRSDTRNSFKTVISEDGIPLKYSEFQGYTELEGEHQAKSDTRFGGFSFEDAVISVDQSIPPLETLNNVMLEIIGVYDGGIYSGYQQRVFTKDGKTFLVLGDDIGVPEKGLPGDAQKHLEENSLYPIEDLAIQKMVGEVVGDTTDDWEKVKALLDHVERYVVDDYTSNSMSVFEVLRKRKGDCSEHTLLFNTLARAAGIPSREVRGLMNYEDRKFGLHAWNEVLVGGEWHSVDATWGYTTTPLTHIKFDGHNYIPSSFDFRIVDVN